MAHSVNEEGYWTQRYEAGQTGWDMGQVSPPLKAYFDPCYNSIPPRQGNEFFGLLRKVH